MSRGRWIVKTLGNLYFLIFSFRKKKSKNGIPKNFDVIIFISILHINYMIYIIVGKKKSYYEFMNAKVMTFIYTYVRIILFLPSHRFHRQSMILLTL